MSKFSPAANHLEPRRVTPADSPCFFGYYDKSPWDPSGHRMLACRADFDGRPPGPEDVLTIGIVDLETEGFTPVADTRAWNWQQGCMLQWLDNRRIVFNDRREKRFVAVIFEVEAGERWELPRPVYSVHAERGIAASLNFARLHRLRPGYGYAGVEDPTTHQCAPTDDGLSIMSLETGEAELKLSIAKARDRLGSDTPGADPGRHWMNHAQFAPGGERLAVMHRWETGDPELPWRTRLLTIGPDGGEPYPLVDDGVCSHYDWYNDQCLLGFARVRSGRSAVDGFHLFTDRTGEASPFARSRLTGDGHCSFSPDHRWLLNDTYPDPVDGKRTLMLVRVEDEAVFEVGRFYGPLPELIDTRCDLHPRWSRDGKVICFDSVHEGTRGMYLVDVSPILEGRVKPITASKEGST